MAFKWQPKRSRICDIPLQWVMVIPFVVQIITAVGLVGYLSYRSVQESVNQLTNRLQNEVNNRVTEKTTNYLQSINQINKNNISALRRGVWSFDDFSSQERQAWEQMQLFPSITIVGFGTPLGGHRAVELLKNGTFVIREAPNNGGSYMSFTTKPDGSPDQGTQTSVYFDARQRPWFQAAVQAKKATWTKVYPHVYTNELLVSLSEPIYDLKTNEFLGVTYGLRNLEEMSRFLRTIDMKSGVAFIMEIDETLVANSTDQKPYQLSENPKEQKLLKAIDSQDLLISSSAKQIRDRYGSLEKLSKSEQFNFTINGDRYFLNISPYKNDAGLDWLIVTVLPESDFMTEIHSSRNQTILLIVITLIIATAIGLITANWIVAPISQIGLASKAIAEGNWADNLADDGAIAEINSLSTSFNQMSDQLRKALDKQAVELKDKAYWLNTIIEAMPDTVFMKDGNGKYLVVNRPGVELFDLMDIDYMGKTDLELAELNESYREALRYCAATDEVVWQHNSISYGEEHIRKPDGRLYIMDVVKVPLFNEDSSRKGLVVIGRDISDRKQAEIKLQQSEENNRAILHAIPNLLLRVDRDGFCYSFLPPVNEQSDKYLPVKTHLSEVLPPDLLRFELQQIDRALTTGKLQVWEHQIPKLDKICYEEVRVAPCSKDECLIIVRDISDRKQAEAKLQKSELSLIQAQAIAHIGNWEFDLQSQKISWSKELFRMFGLDPSQPEPSYSEYLQLIHVDDRILLQESIERAITYGIPYKIYYRAIQPDGSIRYHEGRAEVFCNEQGQITRLFGTNLDITDYKNTEIALAEAKEAAEAATKAKSAFLANMSHEIRTPMNGVLGMAQILETTELTEEQADFVKIIKDSGEALLVVINDILDFSKIESGQLEIQAQSFNLAEVISGVYRLLQPQAENKQINLKYEIAPDIPETVIGDSIRLRQILLNLVGNAVKFTQYGDISLSVTGQVLSEFGKSRSNKYQLSFTIADTGIGIKSDRINQLFQPFTQADASISRKYGGTGLGLAISKRLVELMGGTIWVESFGQVGGNPPLDWESQFETQGSRFNFVITLLLTEAIALPQSSSKKENLIYHSIVEKFPFNILLVEDNQVNQVIANLMLKRLGYKIRIVNNGLEALNAMKEQEYNLIFMDIQMPVMDGLTAAKLIREIYTGSDIKIVAMTANALDGDRQACLDMGMDDYISKPIMIQDVIRVITA